MTAVRERIFAAIEERLAEIDGIAEVERQPSGEPAAFPALAIWDGGQTTDQSEPGINRYALELRIEGCVEQSGGANGHTALNELYAATVAALVSDPPLGGLAETIDEGELRAGTAPLASKQRLYFNLDFTITFPTTRADPAQSA